MSASQRAETRIFGRLFKDYESRVASSYAHNSRLYKFLEERAQLAEIVSFLKWDAVQPPFAIFLKSWLERAPDFLRDPLQDHIDVEVDEEHSRLFNEMLSFLCRYEDPKPEIDFSRLEDLNYPFSERCVAEKSFGYFLGVFFATELMSQKRCSQIQCGLERFGFRGSELDYFRIHAISDKNHYGEIFDLMIHPLELRNPEESHWVIEGLNDRLTRSASYLQWYETSQLNLRS